MSVYLGRIVEVRKHDKKDQWSTVCWSADGKEHCSFLNNACFFKEELKDSKYADRLIPSDLAEKTKEELKDVHYATWMTLDELYSFAEYKKIELLDEIKRVCDGGAFKIINDKLNAIMQHKECASPEETFDYVDTTLDYYKRDEGMEYLFSVTDEVAIIHFIAQHLGDTYFTDNIRVIYYWC